MYNGKNISVVLASYNGIKYIKAQLDSISAQTLKPDEVIISDDNSTDGTFEFCGKYIADNNLEGWKLLRNEGASGAAGNFRYALKKSSGYYVFTCDQDDEWMPDKIQSMVSAMNDHQEIKLLVSNYIPLVNEKPVKVYLKNLERDDGSIIPFRLKISWFDVLRPGCTYCVRHELIDMFDVFDVPDDWHDAMLWKYALVQDSLYLLCRKLIYWKRHEGTATQAITAEYPDVTSKLRTALDEEKMYQKFLDASDKLNISPEKQKLIKAKIDFIRRRRAVLEGRNILRIALFVMINFKYYPTLRNSLSDIYAVIFRRS